MLERWDPTVLGLVLALACASSCTRDQDGGNVFGDGDGSEAGTADASGPGGSTDSGATDGPATTGSDDGTKYDVGNGGGETVGEEGCEKADFLFVIDSSGSMGDNQTNLIGSFPDFIATIQATLQGQDYHIMVVDTDGQDICDGLCEDGAPHCALGGFDCGQVPLLSGCDIELGAGNVHDVDKQACPIDGGIRYMTQDQTDLGATFECVARVGTYGDGNEQPMGAMMEALSDTMNVAGCNDGFLRDDAILVLTVLTDAPPDTATEQVNGVPQQWYDAVVAAKNGNANAVSVLGLVSDGDVPGGLCSGNMDDSQWGAPKLRDFVELFPYHVLDSVCQPDYGPFFDAAVQVIDQSCDEFVPEG